MVQRLSATELTAKRNQIWRADSIIGTQYARFGRCGPPICSENTRACVSRVQSQAGLIANLSRREIIFVAIKINLHSRVSLYCIYCFPCVLRNENRHYECKSSRYFEERKSMFFLNHGLSCSERKKKFQGPADLTSWKCLNWRSTYARVSRHEISAMCMPPCYPVKIVATGLRVSNAWALVWKEENNLLTMP